MVTFRPSVEKENMAGGLGNLVRDTELLASPLHMAFGNNTVPNSLSRATITHGDGQEVTVIPFPVGMSALGVLCDLFTAELTAAVSRKQNPYGCQLVTVL